MTLNLKERLTVALAAFRSPLITLVAALAVVGFAVGPALALSLDSTRIINKRNYDNQQPVYYRLTVNYNDKSIASGVQFAQLSAGDYIQSIDCDVTTAFNAGTTNAVTFGTTAANANEIVASGITTSTPGIYHLTSAAGLGLAVTGSADEPIFAKYAQTGTAATTGSVTCVFTVIPNNDD